MRKKFTEKWKKFINFEKSSFLKKKMQRKKNKTTKTVHEIQKQKKTLPGNKIRGQKQNVLSQVMEWSEWILSFSMKEEVLSSNRPIALFFGI